MAAPALALLLASCTTFDRITTPVSLPDSPPKQAEATPTAREHNRILAAYGGAYQDAGSKASSPRRWTSWSRLRNGRA